MSRDKRNERDLLGHRGRESGWPDPAPRRSEAGLEASGRPESGAYPARGPCPDPHGEAALRLGDCQDARGEGEAAGPCTHLPTPQVAARLGLEDEDVIGVEGGGPGWDLKGLGIVDAGPPDLEQPCGGHRLHAVSPRGASLQGERGRSNLVKVMGD